MMDNCCKLVINDPLQASHAELTWLNDREDKETGRDWADKNLKLGEVEQYYEVGLTLIEHFIRPRPPHGQSNHVVQ